MMPLDRFRVSLSIGGSAVFDWAQARGLIPSRTGGASPPAALGVEVGPFGIVGLSGSADGLCAVTLELHELPGDRLVGHDPGVLMGLAYEQATRELGGLLQRVDAVSIEVSER